MSPRPSSSSIQASVPVFAALGEETRLHVLSQLSARGRLSITELTEGTRVTRQAVTKHLEILERVGLVRGYRDGRERMWELEPDGLDDARHTLEAISKRWDAALERLRKMVETK
jgi:DNA-binding transcriptional ArsR family regulator